MFGLHLTPRVSIVVRQQNRETLDGEEMVVGASESDWKVFRKLRDPALERYCKRVLDELDQISSDMSRSHHERYLEVCRLLGDRDKTLARAFDAPSRSQMLRQLAAMHALELLEADELARFPPDTQESITAMAELFSQ